MQKLNRKKLKEIKEKIGKLERKKKKKQDPRLLQVSQSPVRYQYNRAPSKSRPSRHPTRRINQPTIGSSPPSLAKSRSGLDNPPALQPPGIYPDMQALQAQRRPQVDICPSEGITQYSGCCQA